MRCQECPQASSVHVPDCATVSVEWPRGACIVRAAALRPSWLSPIPPRARLLLSPHPLKQVHARLCCSPAPGSCSCPGLCMREARLGDMSPDVSLILRWPPAMLLSDCAGSALPSHLLATHLCIRMYSAEMICFPVSLCPPFYSPRLNFF